VAGHGAAACSGTVTVVRGIGVLSDGGVVVMGKPELPPPLVVVSPSSVDSLRIVCSGSNPL
jgi:hypothetical protein